MSAGWKKDDVAQISFGNVRILEINGDTAECEVQVDKGKTLRGTFPLWALKPQRRGARVFRMKPY